MAKHFKNSSEYTDKTYTITFTREEMRRVASGYGVTLTDRQCDLFAHYAEQDVVDEGRFEHYRDFDMLDEDEWTPAYRYHSFVASGNNFNVVEPFIHHKDYTGATYEVVVQVPLFDEANNICDRVDIDKWYDGSDETIYFFTDKDEADDFLRSITADEINRLMKLNSCAGLEAVIYEDVWENGDPVDSLDPELFYGITNGTFRHL